MQLEVREFLKNPCKKTRAVVKKEHFEGAFKMITPSVSIQVGDLEIKEEFI